MSELERLLPEVSAIARDAGRAILEVYAGSFSVQRKDDATPLTAADMAAHRLIVDALEAMTPQWPVLSEESAEVPWQTRREWHRYWLVDPLDGTREFVKRNGEFTVNIALIENHESVLGVVLAPVTGNLYRATRGGGANLERSAGTIPEPLETVDAGHPVRVAGSRSHPSPEAEQRLAALGDYELLPMGSSLKFCLIAAGEADLYLRLGPTSEWDTAAAQCVLEEAGGAVLNQGGEPLAYNRKDSLLNPPFAAIGDTSVDWIGKVTGKA